jgi:hypothetical protein
MSLSRHTALAALTLVALPALTVPATVRRAGQRRHDPRQRPHPHGRRGDTLWDLSGSYLDNPFLWPEIYRLNTDVDREPRTGSTPGERLALPDAAAVAAEAGAPDERPLFSQSALTTRSPVAPERMEPARMRFAAVRRARWTPPPFVDRLGGPANSGRIVQSAARVERAGEPPRPGVDPQRRGLRHAPDGQHRARGRPLPRLRPRRRAREARAGGWCPPVWCGSTRVDAGGAAPRGAAHAPVRAGHGGPAPPAARLGAAGAGAPRRARWTGRWTRRWCGSRTIPVLASVQRYVVLDASARRGVRVGDQFTLVRPPLTRTETRPGAPRGGDRGRAGGTRDALRGHGDRGEPDAPGDPRRHAGARLGQNALARFAGRPWAVRLHRQHDRDRALPSSHVLSSAPRPLPRRLLHGPVRAPVRAVAAVLATGVALHVGAPPAHGAPRRLRAAHRAGPGALVRRGWSWRSPCSSWSSSRAT